MAVGGALGALALGAAALAIVPQIEHGKERGAERVRRQTAAAVRAEEHRLRVDQRPHSARGRVRQGGGMPGAQLAARRALRGELERSITRDARGRVAQGTLHGPILRTECEPVAGEEARLRRRTGLYRCLAVRGTGTTAEGLGTEHGYPFVATIDYRSARYTWCKTNPQAGEKAGRNFAHVKLSRSCAGRLSEVL